MSRKAWGIIGLVFVLSLAAYWWGFGAKRSTPANDPARSMFLRPTTLAPSAAGFGVFIDGIDGLEDVPAVACNQKFSMTVITAQKSTPGAMELFFVVPRLPNQGAEAFEWTDVSCDLLLALNHPRPVPLGTDWAFELQGTFRLKPGEYLLRYYRQSRNFDAEKGLPRTEFVGEGRLRVTPSESTEPSFVPLENKKNLLRNPVKG